MNKIFCHNCGAKIEYSIKKPNFCFKCGECFNSLAISSIIKSPPGKEIVNDEDQEFDDQDTEPIDLDFKPLTIQVDIEKNTQILGNIAGTVEGKPSRDRIKPNPRKSLRELREFVSRKPTRIDDD